jgi:hypothetical protein
VKRLLNRLNHFSDLKIIQTDLSILVEVPKQVRRPRLPNNVKKSKVIELNETKIHTVTVPTNFGTITDTNTILKLKVGIKTNAVNGIKILLTPSITKSTTNNSMNIKNSSVYKITEKTTHSQEKIVQIH